MTKILILGAYGLVGSAVTRCLDVAGHSVTGLGRDPELAARVLPGVAFVYHDMAHLDHVHRWTDVIDGFDMVVNCAGALQTTPHDDVEAVHNHAVGALAGACAAQQIGLVQISTVGSRVDAPAELLASKGRGDEAIRKVRGTYWILRHGLVISDTAYGGTQVLRMLAAVPWVQPMAYGETQIQTTAIDDILRAVLGAVEGSIPAGTDADLVEAERHSLADVVLHLRAWLGFPAARRSFGVPEFVMRTLTRVADGLGTLGWRAPVCGEGLEALRGGIVGTHDPNLLPATQSYRDTLASMIPTQEHRLAARMALLMPIAIGVLAWFWITSGLFGLIRIKAAAALLLEAGWPLWISIAAVAVSSVVNLALGALVLVRRYARQATLGMVAVSAFYLLGATITTPQLWFDPLGPLVKMVPALVLALVARVMLDNR